MGGIHSNGRMKVRSVRVEQMPSQDVSQWRRSVLFFFVCLSFSMIAQTDGSWHPNINRKHSRFILSAGIWHQQATGKTLLRLCRDTRSRCSTGQRNVNEVCCLPGNTADRILELFLYTSWTLSHVCKCGAQGWFWLLLFFYDQLFGWWSSVKKNFTHFLHSLTVLRHSTLFSSECIM